MIRRAIGLKLRLPLSCRPLYTSQVLLARKRSNKGFVERKEKNDDDDDDHLAKFERSRVAEKAVIEQRQKSRDKQRKKKQEKVKEETDTLEKVVKFVFGALWFFVGWVCWDLVSYQQYSTAMDKIDSMDTVSKHDFFERYLKKGKVNAIYRMFNSGPTDVNSEFIIETIKGKRFIVICSFEPFQRNLAQIEADLRINPNERFSTKGDFAIFDQSLRFRHYGDRKAFKDALDREGMLALVNLAILVPMVAFLGTPNKTNFAKLARQVSPIMQQMKKQEKQMGSANKSSAGHIKPVKVTNVTLADVAGMKGEKEEIQEFIQFLKNSSKYTRIGATMPKGLLLHGPPGTGKTLFGKAIAGECNVPFYYANGSDFNKSHVGEGAKLVRDLFAKARTNQPCIIYIDEIDSVGGKRSDGSGGDFGSDKDSTLNQLLVEMDGLTTNQEIVVMGATNRADVLDPALKRPGRLTRDIMCGLPDRDGREEILRVHMGKIKTLKHPRHYAPKLAELTVGMSGAQLANVCNEAALAAARDSNAELIDAEHFEEAIDRVLTGLKKRNAVQAADEKRTLAVIEGGKCLVSWLLTSQDPVLKTTITPRTNSSMGHTQFKTGERQLKSEEYLIDRIAVLTAGKIAQRILQGRILESVQGDKDLARAQNIAEEMVRVYGMGQHTGQVNLSGMVQNTPYGEKQLFSDNTKKSIDMDRMIILQQGRQIAEQLIEGNKDKLIAIVNHLNKHEVITDDGLKAILGDKISDEE